MPGMKPQGWGTPEAPDLQVTELHGEAEGLAVGQRVCWVQRWLAGDAVGQVLCTVYGTVVRLDARSAPPSVQVSLEGSETAGGEWVELHGLQWYPSGAVLTESGKACQLVGQVWESPLGSAWAVVASQGELVHLVRQDGTSCWVHCRQLVRNGKRLA